MTVALITGAGSGIGAATALLAAEQGYGVAVLDIDSSRAEQVAEQVRRLGVASLALIADVADEAAVDGAFASCVEHLGLPTAVLANAGIERNAPGHELPLSDWQAMIAINLTGAFLTARAAIANLIAADQAGSIVITSSPAATVGFAGGGNAGYAASKGGVTAMARSLAIDYASRGIRINTIVPGATDTPLLVEHLPPGQRRAARARLHDEASRQIPIGRLADPREIAETALWLWSPARRTSPALTSPATAASPPAAPTPSERLGSPRSSRAATPGQRSDQLIPIRFDGDQTGCSSIRRRLARAHAVASA